MLILVFILNFMLIAFNCEASDNQVSTNMCTFHIVEPPKPLHQTTCGKEIEIVYTSNNFIIKQIDIKEKKVTLGNKESKKYEEVFQVNESLNDKLSYRKTCYCYIGMNGRTMVDEYKIPCDFYFTIYQPYDLFSQTITTPHNKLSQPKLKSIYLTKKISCHEVNNEIEILNVRLCFNNPKNALFCLEEKTTSSYFFKKQKHYLCEVTTPQSISYQVIYRIIDKNSTSQINFNSVYYGKEENIYYNEKKLPQNSKSYIKLISDEYLSIDEYLQNPNAYELKLIKSERCSENGKFYDFLQKFKDMI